MKRRSRRQMWSTSPPHSGSPASTSTHEHSAAMPHELRSRERQSQITDDLIDRIAAHPEDYDVAANTDPNARLEAETPDD